MRKMRDLVLASAGLYPPGRRLRVAATDTFIASYPRSGNTWMRFLLTSLLRPDEPLDADLVRRVVPDIYKESARTLARTRPPRILKSHEYFDPRYQKVVYLIRDPRDVSVSYFHFLTGIGSPEAGGTLEDFVPRFVMGVGDGWGTWAEHVQSWVATRGSSSSFLLVRYEDLRSHPHAEVRRTGEFLGLERTEDEIVSAIEASSFERMKRGQASGSARSNDQPSLRARQGIVEGWRRELSEEGAQTIERAFGTTMTAHGYV